MKGINKSEDQKYTIKNIKTLYQLYNDYSQIASKAKYRSIYGERLPLDLATRLKILIPKQTIQRLSLALAQAETGNTSENHLNVSY